MTTQTPTFTAPGMDVATSARIIEILQARLHASSDLHLTLKHVHWNVVGPQFIAVHEMLDPQVVTVRGMADELAERIAALGGTPIGTPGVLTSQRTWEDYALGRATTQEHLQALDLVYRRTVTDFRAAVQELEPLDPVTQDLLIGHTRDLEQFQWFIRAHLESPSGELATP